MQVKSGGLHHRIAATGGGKMLRVNNRHLGAIGNLSQGFKTSKNAGVVREKMQLKRMMIKANHEHYKKNPLMGRRLQHEIVHKASGIYGINKKKLMSKVARANPSAHYGMRSGTGKP